jgi:two-component system KDP operon response regulator KdpE
MYLANRRGQVLSHRELLTNVWGSEFSEELTYLNVYIRYLCQKIEDDPDRPRYIRTHRDIGYYFAASNGASRGRSTSSSISLSA